MAYPSIPSTIADFNTQVFQLPTGELNFTINSATGCYIDDIGYYVLIF